MIQSLMQYSRLFFMSATTSFLPWMVPLTYAAILWLQIQGVNPHLILLLTVSGSVAGTMLLRYGYIRLWPKIKKYVKIGKERKNDKKIDKKMSKKKSWLKRKAHLLHQKMHIVDKPMILYSIIVINCTLPIPDLVVIMHVQKKVHVVWFFISTVIGKLLNYIPVIYGIELGKALL